jgi:PAS domain S-box-containing protein
MSTMPSSMKSLRTEQGQASQMNRQHETVSHEATARYHSGTAIAHPGTRYDLTQRQPLAAEVAVANPRNHRNPGSPALPSSAADAKCGLFFRKDCGGFYTYGDARFCACLRRALKELIGTTDYDLFPPEIAEKHREHDRRVLETGEVLEVVEAIPLPSCGQRQLQIIKAPIYDSCGKVIGLQGMFLDVTRRRRAEEVLRRQTRLLAAVIAQMQSLPGSEHAPAAESADTILADTPAKPPGHDDTMLGIGGDYASTSTAMHRDVHPRLWLPQNHYFHKDRDGRFVFANRQFCAGLGRPFAEIFGKCDRDFYPAQLAEKYRADDCQVMQSGQVLETLEEHRSPVGQRVFVRVIKAPLYDDQGNVVGVQGAFWDVTDKQRAQSDVSRQSYTLRSIVETLGDGVIVIDEHGELVVANPLARMVLNIHADADWSWPSLACPQMEPPLARALRDQQVVQCELPLKLAEMREPIWLNVVARPILDDNCKVCGAVAILRDVTDRKRQERRRNAEHAVTQVLAESDSTCAAAGRLLAALGESLGWAIGALWTFDADANVLRCVDVWRGDDAYPTFEAVTRQMTVLPGIGLPGRVWASGKSLWIEDVNQDDNFPRVGIAEHDGLHAAFAFPIRGSSSVLGVVEFFNPSIQQPDAALLQMMDSVGMQIGQFIERRRAEQALYRREQELHVARGIQQGLLPKTVPALPGLRVAGACCAAMETGGDYYDFITWSDSSLGGLSGLGIVIGDAIHHGIGAAMLMAHTRAYLRALALSYTDVSQILALTNQRLAEDIGDDRFISLFLAKFDPRSRTLVYASAGHPAGYLLNRDGEVKAMLKSTGTLLGLCADDTFPTGPALTLEEGDLLLLLTDGVLEARSPDDEPYGVGRALAIVRERQQEAPEIIVDALLSAVRSFTRSHPQDDMTVVVAKAV